MARLPYVTDEMVTDDRVKKAFERGRRKRGEVTNIYRLLAHRPEIINTIGPFAQNVQGPGTLDPRFKEILTVRTSHLNRTRYCIVAHELFAKELGVTEEQLAAIDNYEESPLFTEAEKAALRYTDEVVLTDRDVRDETVEELKKHYTTPQIVEMTILIAFIDMVNKFNNGLNTDPQDFSKFKARVEVVG